MFQKDRDPVTPGSKEGLICDLTSKVFGKNLLYVNFMYLEQIRLWRAKCDQTILFYFVFFLLIINVCYQVKEMHVGN